MEEIVRFKIHVTGHVQGVGFRWSAVREARSLGINGFVKNLSDGSVYMEAEGLREQIDVYIEWCRKGPEHGFVKSVQIDTLPPVYSSDFRIEH